MVEIYLDNAATTKVDESVLKEMLPFLKENYGNASSVHVKGQVSKKAIEIARKIVANSLNAKKDEIYFTGSGTESNNFALKGLFFQNYPRKNHIITTKIEHDCTLKTCKWLEKKGAKVTYLDVDEFGFVDLNQLKKSITKKTFLITIIHANNEIGTIQNIEEIGKIAKSKKILFHIDSCQSYTKIPIDVNKMNLDLLTINAHKIHGPKGVGGIFIREGINIIPILHGGGQENGMRSGTENIAGIVGFSKAVEVSKKVNFDYMRKLRDFLIKEILTKIPETKLNGANGKDRLLNNINITFKNSDGEAIQAYLENKGIYVSTGSACMSNTDKSSHVLQAIGLSKNEQNSTVRFSLSKYTTKKDIDYVVKELIQIIKKLRRFK